MPSSKVCLSISKKLDDNQVNLRIRVLGNLIQIKPTHRTNAALPPGEELISIKAASAGFVTNIPFVNGDFAMVPKSHGWFELQNCGISNIKVVVKEGMVKLENSRKPVDRPPSVKRTVISDDPSTNYALYGHHNGILPNGAKVRDRRGPEG